ncbi:MAG: MATE family efflux transporter [Rikenellaceae bacterium]|nr:MATE family efflux transporter [Rikenellaceae bacterium]
MGDKVNNNTVSLGSDSVGRLLMRYAIPAIIAMASSSLYHIIDSIFIGHGVGDAAISGMAVTLPIMNIASAFGAMVGVGAAARISIRLGEGNKRAAERILANAVLLNLVLGVSIMLLFLLFLDPILIFFSGGEANADTLRYAREFMEVIMFGNIITHLYLGLNEQLRASGYPRKAMYIMLLAMALCTVLNPLFIFVFKWGVQGSALATVTAQFVALIIQIRHYTAPTSFLRFKRSNFHFDRHIVWNIISIGMAPFLLNLCASLVTRFMNTALLSYGGTGADDVISRAAVEGDVGDIYVGAYGIMNRVLLLFVMVAQGFNQGMQPIVGYNYGARQYDRVIKVLKYAIMCATVVTTMAFLIGHFFPYQVASMFVDTSEGASAQAMADIVAQGLPVAMLVFPLVGFQIVAGGFFQYIGRAPLAMFLSTTRQLLFLLPMLLILTPEYGAMGAWMAMPIADAAAVIVAGVLLFLQIRKLRRLEHDMRFER